MSINNRPIKALLFDLDGTLVDTAEDFVQVLNEQLEAHGKDKLPAQTVRNTVSDGARALVRLGFGGVPGEDRFESLREELLQRYETLVGNHASLFEGMAEVLDLCEKKNIPWGIITNKPRLYTDLLLDRLDLTKRSAITLCPDDVTKSKPDPESLLLAADRLSLNNKAMVYVGDHERDIEAGNAASMITVSALYGYIKSHELAKKWPADHQINHPSELISLFLT
jgi:phosphoglycolate phosphatase